ncbi:reverse transcriptase [Gossypium australe]|uniref:Reverse transcriptase n=1 Tax=Gossypium australe TaxID=47621 RepID=A0A5B6X943_9ROSI|nr:reverse transcriptase [Gossypium australe]
MWKVGTGTNISISQDIWIPDYVNGRLLSRVGNLQCYKVAGLISSNEREWNKELIVNTFPEDVAELILRIPLSIEPHEDSLAWSGEPTAVFSARSSYKLLQSLDPTAYALHNIYRDFYKKLWRTEIPTKIKIFIWKISWNYIANKVNMYNRRLVNSRLCPRCGGGEETLNHLFRECPVSVEVWKVLSELDLKGFTNVEFSDWLTMAVASLIKINFDGAFDERSKVSASGVVVRDSRRNILLSSADIHRGVHTAFTTEALACRRATQIALDMKEEGIIIEGDSLTKPRPGVIARESQIEKQESQDNRGRFFKRSQRRVMKKHYSLSRKWKSPLILKRQK